MRWCSARLVACLLVVVLLGAVLPLTSRGQQAAPGRDVLILLDVTLSMKGEGPPPATPNIWADVQTRVVDLLGQLSADTSVAVVPFAGGPELAMIWPEPAAATTDPLAFSTLEGDGRAQAILHVTALDPNGQATFICDSLEFALAQLRERREALGEDRNQTIYLYTDGDDTGRCQGRLAEELVNVFNAQVGDFQYLHTVFVDLGQQVTPDDQATIGAGTDDGITFTSGLPDTFDLDATQIDAGNLATAPDGNQVTLRLRGAVPDDGQRRTASIRVLAPAPGVTVTPAVVELAEEMTVTLSASGPFPEGTLAGQLRLIPAEGSFVFSNDSVPFTFAWLPPTPTPGPTETPAPTSTPAPTPTPLATPTPAPTPTPVAAIVVSTDDDPSLGTVEAGSDTPLSGETALLLEFDAEAQRQDANVELVALLDGEERPAEWWIVGPDGQPASRATFAPGTERVVVGYAIDASDASRLLPGSDTGGATIQASSPTAQLRLADATDNDEADAALQWEYTTRYPWSAQLIVLSLLMLVLAALLAWVLLHPRFPADAAVQVIGGNRYELRREAERSPMGRLFGRSLSVGTLSDTIDVSTPTTEARLSASPAPWAFWRRGVFLRPQLNDDGTSPVTVDNHYGEIDGIVELQVMDRVRTSGQTLTYQDSDQ